MLDKTKVDTTLKNALILQGLEQALKSEKVSVVDKVEKAKIWLGKQPDYVKFLQHLQNILHQKNIGAFSELLTYFVKDVLQKEKEIIFDLYTYHNLPALKIEAMNNGFRENIYEGNGGSIANIVSTGLRLIALSRLPHRKFIVLDEPDCWLKPDHVPLFARIIGEISKELNIQTIIISHHHWQYFKDYGRVIELKQDGPHLTTDIIHDTPDTVTSAKRDVVEKVVMTHFMSHYNTTFDLHPHLTCIIGENDIGKSVLATALKAVSYADSSDSYIMHNEKEAKVMIELTGKRQIVWQRFNQTDQDNTQKVKYSYYLDNVFQKSEYSAHETPAFIQKELNVCTTEDIDVHIGNQKEPVFLLSSSTKPQQRAKILSLGKDSLIIQKMMENIKNKTRQLKQSVKEGEERFSMIERQLLVLENIDTIVESIEDLKTDSFILDKQQLSIQEIESAISQLVALAQTAHTAPIVIEYEEPELFPETELAEFLNEYETVQRIAQEQTIDYFVEPVTLHNTEEIEQITHQLEQVVEIAHIDKIEPLAALDSIRSTLEIERAIDMLSQWEQMANMELVQYTDITPVFHEVGDLEETIRLLEQSQTEILELNKKQEQIRKWQEYMKVEEQQLLEEMGHSCPTCHQPITEEHLRGHLHA